MSERGESAKPTTPATIEKRDGRRVSFDRSRIESAVARAQAAVGEEDPSLAKEIAELVEYSLARRHAAAVHEGTPGIEEIQDLVERALIELGRAAVAKAYILYRDRRARARTLAPTQRERERAGSVSVADADGVERWDRARVAQALVSEAGLGRERAEEIAQRVEARVVASGLRRLTDTLVRELTIAELIAAGHAEAVRKQEPVSLSRREFERHLNGAFDTGAPVDRALGAAFFGRWARQEVLGERFLARHVEGSLHLVGEESIHGFSELAVPAEVLLPAAAGAKAPFQLLDEVAGLLPSLSRGIVIEGGSITVTGNSDGTVYEVQATGSFTRADTNEDFLIDIGDVITSLDYLFAAGAGPECLARLDVNDDNLLDIGDPIYLLNALFVSGSPNPPEPFGSFADLVTGPDPTPSTETPCP